MIRRSTVAAVAAALALQGESVAAVSAARVLRVAFPAAETGFDSQPWRYCDVDLARCRAAAN